MISVNYFYKNLLKNDIHFFSGVPDSLLKDICAFISDNVESENHVIAANEGNAIALGIGYHLSTNKIPLIYLQNSGLGNIVNPLLSLADSEVYSIPMLLLIGWRGEPGISDEPQHRKQGRVTLDILEAMEIPYQLLSQDTDDEEAQKIINFATKEATKNNTPVAIVVKKGAFSKYMLRKSKVNDLPLLREEAIRVIVDNLNHNDIVVSTTGVTSRELFEYREELNHGHEKDFLTVGGMGHASQIALAIALKKPSKNVFCLDGDGAALMHLGSMAINGNTECNNFKHILFNNGAHDSVGGQPTVGLSTDFQSIAKACGYDYVMSAKTISEIVKCLYYVRSLSGKVFFEIRIEKGFRNDLTRPGLSPKENKKNLMKFIREN